MSERPDPPEDSALAAFRAPFVGMPRGVWALAAGAALLHMAPVWIAQASTPDGWVFSGILTQSPDYMQYRVWMQQVLDEGMVVSNGLTPDPTGRFLPVLLYWILGHLAAWGGWRPEFVYQYAGGVLAAILAVLAWGVLRRFVPSGRPRSVALAVLLVGGGIGGFLRLAEMTGVFASVAAFDIYLLEPTRLVPIFEDYRQHYFVNVFFDTHFLFIWVLATLSVLAFLAGRGRGGAGWTLVTALLWGVTSLAHVYTGLTLVSIGAFVLLLDALDGRFHRADLARAVVPVMTVAGVLLWMLARQRASGFPMPRWREPLILPTTLLLAFPLQFALLAWRGGAVWRHRDDDTRALFGWALGCLVLTLAGPFYPYPSRGTMTLAYPLTALAALAWIRGGRRIGGPALLTVLVLTGSTLAWRMGVNVQRVAVADDKPWSYLTPDHLRILDALETASSPESVLLAGEPDVLWLVPRNRGRPWVAHFFLTSQWDRRAAEARRFFDGEAEPSFLEDRGIDLAFVPAGAPVGPMLRGRPGVEVVADNAVGTLFRVRGTP